MAVNPEQFLGRLKALRGNFSTSQLVSFAAAFLLVTGGIITLAYWLNAPTYTTLFTDLEPDSASQVVARLRDQKVPYQLVDGGRTIRVPDTAVDQLRLDFAGQAMPLGGRIGFELFDATNFGETDFREQVNFRRALEGELARTIATIDEIAGARVHIALPPKPVFARERAQAKASVTLRLRGRGRLSPQTVTGIRNLVAYSIEDLRPEAVVVMDDRGRPLAAAGDSDDPLGPAQLEARSQLEEQVARSVSAMLEPVVGADRFRVRVAALVSQDTQDILAEQFGRDGSIRSEERIVEGGAGTPAASGVAGARANLPAPAQPGSNVPSAETLAPPPVTTTAGGAQRTAEKRNLELDKTTTRTLKPAGSISRLSVAILVDNAVETTKDAQGTETRTSKPRDPAFLQQIGELASKAAGLDTARGDVLTVQNIEFSVPVDEVPEAAPLPLLQRVNVLAIVGSVLGIVALLAAFVVFKRSARARAVPAKPAEVATQVLPQQQLPRTIEDIEGEIEARLDADTASRLTDRKMPVLTKRLTGLVQKEPEAAARLVRSWLLEEKKA
jgi:flagellar M-ring protein FliF